MWSLHQVGDSGGHELDPGNVMSNGEKNREKAFDEFTLAIMCPFFSTCYPVNVCYFKWVNDK